MSKPYSEPFSIVPWQVFFDPRLGKRHLKVLGALLSYRRASTAPFWATRKQISERCGVDENRISHTTTELEKMGWLVKHGSGRVAVRYEFHNPLFEDDPTLTETVTVPKTVTVTETVRVKRSTLTETVSQPLPKQSHSESHTENLNKKQPLKTIVQQAARFEEFWAGYPVKKGKAKAMKSWKSKGCDAIADQIIENVQHMQAHDDDWARGYIPHGSTYVAGELWNDEPRRKPGTGAQQPSKTMQGIQALETMKNEQRKRRLDPRGISDGAAKAAVSSSGPNAGG